MQTRGRQAPAFRRRDTECCSIERLGIDDDTAFAGVRAGYLGESSGLHELCHGEPYLLYALRPKFSFSHTHG